MMGLAVIKKQKARPLTMFQKIAKNDRTAIADCLDNYGDLVWAMASNLTNSSEDAENVVREIFLDIWRDAVRLDSTDFDELVLITIIARRHLMEHSKQVTQMI